MLNLLLSIFLSVDRTTDECMWYFINLFVDTTLGVFICFAFTILVEKLARWKNIKYLKSGLYYEKYVKNDGKTRIRLKLKMYFSQLGMWVLIVIIVRIYIKYIFIYFPL
jgi:hypothetical protein